MPRPTKCIFCGGVPLSKEHVLGRWLTPVVAKAPTGKKLYVDSERWSLDGLERQPRRFPKEIDFQVRCVCEACNSGWMSAIETEVKPIIEALNSGSQSALGRAEQFSLAKWAVKTAIITRYFGGKHEVPLHYRKWFFEHQDVPQNTFVWVGTYVGELVVSLQSRDIAFHDLTGKTLSFSHAQFVVLATGRLVVCVFTAYVMAKLAVTNEGLIGEHLRGITPYHSDIVWPLPALDDRGRTAIYETNWDAELIIQFRPGGPEPSK